MQKLYCGAHHAAARSRAADDLCADCAALAEYAYSRLKNCPYQERKPSCAKCPIHCYRAEMRQRVREMMRFSGPRILFHHPLIAFQHLLDTLRKPPASRRTAK